ncbi:MAG: L,D-transpeptidase [Candidatus Paceibacteria bacterium]
MRIIVSKSKQEKAYVVAYDGAFFNCVIGREGMTDDKKEGDWCTPRGVFNIKQIFYRADRLEDFECSLPKQPLKKEDGWDDDPQSPFYNTQVLLPHAYSAEELWREDELYDLILVLDYNQNPAIPGKGSAIFIHVSKEGMEYTKGCVALKKADLLALLSQIGPSTQVEIL